MAATKALAANVATPTSTPTALCAQSATRHLVRCPFVRLSPELHLKEARDASYPSSLLTPHSAPASVPGPDSGPLEGPGRRKQNLLLSRKRHRRCLTRCWFLVCRVPLPLALCLIFNVQLQRCLAMCVCWCVCVCIAALVRHVPLPQVAASPTKSGQATFIARSPNLVRIVKCKPKALLVTLVATLQFHSIH